MRKNIAEIRSDHHYWLPLTYRKNDRFKIPFAKGVLGYFIGSEDLSFMARVIPAGENKEIKDSKKRLKYRTEGL